MPIVFLALFFAVFASSCAPSPKEESTQDASLSDEPPCLPQVETCNGKDDDCDGQIDNGAACGHVADHSCRLGGAFNSGECVESEACRKTSEGVFVCIAIPPQQTPHWHAVSDVLTTCNDKSDGTRMLWRGEWYICDLCDQERRWRKEKGPRCAKDGVLDWHIP